MQEERCAEWWILSFALHEQDFKYTLQLTSYELASRNSPGFNKNRTKPEQSIGRPYTKHTAETKLKEIDVLNTTAPNVKDDKIAQLTNTLTNIYQKVNTQNYEGKIVTLINQLNSLEQLGSNLTAAERTVIIK
uniref:Uncharacterized protein n=1 Tax=Glossina austeni TaxID=7395 RepID=A0A1A9VH45_GLOAU